jgi:hypothetical protein
LGREPAKGAVSFRRRPESISLSLALCLKKMDSGLRRNGTAGLVRIAPQAMTLARVPEFAHHDGTTFGTERMMQRQRAIAIAAQRQAEMHRLILLASLLLLPVALLLLLISP